LDISRFVCPPGWEWIGEWAPVIDGNTDAQGWRYNRAFTLGSKGFHPGEEALDFVRTRKLFRQRRCVVPYARHPTTPNVRSPHISGGHRGGSAILSPKLGDGKTDVLHLEEKVEELSFDAHPAKGSPHHQLFGSHRALNVTDEPLPIDTEEKEQLRLVYVDIIAGRKIPKKDFLGLSDPFCIVHVAGNDNQTQFTAAIQNTTEPVWKETHWFNVSKDDKLIVDCYDEDPVGKDFIGSVSFDLADVFSGKIKPKDPQWYQLKEKGKDAGEVQIAFS